MGGRRARGRGRAGGRGGRSGDGRGDAGREPENRRTCGGRRRAFYPPGSVGRRDCRWGEAQAARRGAPAERGSKLQRAGLSAAPPAASAGSRARSPPRAGSGAPAFRRPGPPLPATPRRGAWCLRGASVGAGAAAGARDPLGPAGALGAAERGARRRAASSSCRTGHRRPAAAAETERRRRRRPGQRRERSGTGSGSCHCQLPAGPQGRQPEQHYRHRPE